MSSAAESGPNFLLEWREADESLRHWSAGIGTLIFHAVVITLAFVIGGMPGPPPRQATEIITDLTRVTRLYLPADLTQKAPNKGKVAKDISVEDLKPRPPQEERLPPAPAIRAFRPPSPAPPGPQSKPGPPRIATPPKIDTSVTAQNTPPVLPALAGAPNAPPPPQIQPVERPALAVKAPGQQGTSDKNKGKSKLAPPKSEAQSNVHQLARGGGGQNNVVTGDLDQPPQLPANIQLPPVQGHTGSSLELMSDPMGVDFKPYLMQILATVRKNWFAVWPASARRGNQGVVQLQFIIDRHGEVPKLVIATPSGSQSLDRAAVAGISASVPFPPLPTQFKGQEIRLQFAFSYNIR